jgi:glycosyltransferase involved in cell wall biosynthesis
MRIAYLVSQFLAVNHTYLRREVATLRTLGLDILVISIAPPDRSPEELGPDEREEALKTLNVKTTPAATAIRIHLRTLLTRPGSYLRGLVYALRIGLPGLRNLVHHLLYFGEAVLVGHWIRDSGISHFHVHYSSTVGMLVTSIFPLTMSITLHGRGEFVDPNAFHLPEKLRAAFFVCAISNFARSRIMLSCDPDTWSKIEVCRLGVDPNRHQPARFRPAPEPFEILSVGQLVPVKAHHVLLRAIKRLVEDGHRVRLRLIGDGENSDDLKRQAGSLGLADCVVFEGRVNHERVSTLYAETDLFVMSSLDEGVPVVLMEAMALEVPCVATHVAGIPELIRPGVDGLLVAPSDDEGLALAMASLIRDPDLRRRMAQSGRQRIIEAFNLQRNCAELAAIFARRLGGNGLAS